MLIKLLNNKKFSLSGEALYFSLVSVFARLINFIGFPILARSFTVDEVGLLDIHITAVMLSSAFLTFGIDSALLRYHHKYKKIDQLKILITNFMTFLLAVSVFVFSISGILYYLNNIYGSIFNQLAKTSIIFITGIPFIILFSIIELFLRLELQKYKYLMYVLGLNLSILFATIFIYFNQPADTEMYALCYILSYVIFGLLGIYLIRNYIAFFKFKMIEKEILKYAIPMGLITILSMLTPLIDRILILSLTNSNTLGLYSAAAKIAILISLPSGIFQNAITPIIIREIDDIKLQARFHELLRLYLIFLSVAAIVIVCFDKQIINLILGSRYENSYLFIAPLIFFAIGQTNISLFAIGTVLSDKVKYRLILVLIFLIISSTLIWTCGVNWGGLGISFSIIFAKFLHIIAELRLSKKVFPLRFDNLFVINVTVILAITLMLLLLLNEKLFERILFSIISISIIFYYYWKNSRIAGSRTR